MGKSVGQAAGLQEVQGVIIKVGSKTKYEYAVGKNRGVYKGYITDLFMVYHMGHRPQDGEKVHYKSSFSKK